MVGVGCLFVWVAWKDGFMGKDLGDGGGGGWRSREGGEWWAESGKRVMPSAGVYGIRIVGGLIP